MKKILRALENYQAHLFDVAHHVVALRAAGLATFPEADVADALQVTQKYIRVFSGKPNDDDIQALSDDLDDIKLGHFSTDSAFEKAKGRIVSDFDKSIVLRDKIIDLVQR
jgi:hypothetical protein